MPPESDDQRAELATRLRGARDYLGLSQDEVASYLNLPRTAITQMEKGERRVGALELKQLAELYKRPIDYFTGAATAPELPKEIEHLAKTASKLEQEDREELARFAEFLQSKAGRK